MREAVEVGQPVGVFFQSSTVPCGSVPAGWIGMSTADSKGEGIASSFGIRSLVWKPASVLAPLSDGWLMGAFGIEQVFFLGGAAALSGVALFLGILPVQQGRGALREW